MADRGWRQSDLVREARGALSKSTVSRWLDGTAPDLDGLATACATLGRPVTEFLLAAGYLQPQESTVVVEREDIGRLDLPALVARGQAVLEELAARVPDDVSVEDPTPLRRRVVPVVRPEGVEGRDWAALRHQD